jgi:hypothetical protein
MITELLINIFVTPLELIISLLPSLNFLTLPNELALWFANILISVGYFLPVADLLVIFGLWMLVINFNVVWKLILRIWDSIPLV